MDAGFIAAILAPITALVTRLQFVGRPQRIGKTLDGLIASYKALGDHSELEGARQSVLAAITAQAALLEPRVSTGRVEGSRDPNTLIVGAIVAGLFGYGGYYIYGLGNAVATVVGWLFWTMAALLVWASIDVFVRGPARNRPAKE
jgi:hypothetical protein